MKSLMFIRFTAILFALIVGSVYAQEVPPYPGGPAIGRAPEMSSWKVTCQPTPPPGTPTAAGAAAPHPLATSTVVRTKNLRSIETVDSEGLKAIRFFNGTMESYTPPGSSIAVYLFGESKKMPGIYIDFSQTDFPECAWVNPGAYSGIQTVGDHKCLVFMVKKASPSPALVADPNDAASSIAYVDLGTRLPIKNQVGGLTYTYQYLPPPTEMLPLPVLMKARIDFEAQRAKALSVHAAAE